MLMFVVWRSFFPLTDCSVCVCARVCWVSDEFSLKLKHLTNRKKNQQQKVLICSQKNGGVGGDFILSVGVRACTRVVACALNTKAVGRIATCRTADVSVVKRKRFAACRIPLPESV